MTKRITKNIKAFVAPRIGFPHPERFMAPERKSRNIPASRNPPPPPKPTNKYKDCNHHHDLTGDHREVDFGDGRFVANVAAIPLLKALNEAGLRTRTHHYTGDGPSFISILLDDSVSVEIKTVNEINATRSKYNGKKELLIHWGFKP